MAVESLFSYDANTTTPQQLARKRALVQAMLTGKKTPTNWGEGVGAILSGLAAGSENRQLDQQEAAGQASAKDALSTLYGGGPFLPAPGGGPVADGGSAPASVDLSGDKQTFIQSLMPAAQEASQRTGVDPRIIVAQAAQETGWGKHAPGNNFFGIKSHGQSGGQNLATTEYINGKPVKVNDSFRGYASPADSVAGYADFLLKNPRYKPMMGAQGMDAQLQALGASGYATDPNYAQSVGSIARGLPMPSAAAANDAMATGQPVPPAPEQVASLDPSIGMAQASPVQMQPGPIPNAGQQQSAFIDRMTSPQSMTGGAPMPMQGGPAPQQVAQAAPQDLSQIPPMAGGTAGTVQPGQQSGPSMEVLMKAYSNPWLDDNQRQMVGMLLKQKLAAQDPANQLDMDYKRAQIAKLTDPNARDKFGNSVIWGQDADGKWVAMQPSSGGGLVPAKTPDGISLSPPGIGQVNLGTSYGFRDRNGNMVNNVPIDNAGKASATAEGTAQGAAAFDLPRVEQNAEQTLGILERMKAHPGRPGSTGFIQGMLPSRTSDQVDFQSLVDQTQGQSFLQAFQMLKGGGQITEVEGQKATDAISRLRNQRLSDADYLQAITDLEDVVKKGLARAKVQAGQGGQPQATGAPTASPNNGGVVDYRDYFGGQ